ncbi:MAG: choice-of-anchor D domain-containing protein [Myxococcota bacterium]|nr:choice-of-anchor D domain-containing protein [Myxococcota bacterium]
MRILLTVLVLFAAGGCGDGKGKDDDTEEPAAAFDVTDESGTVVTEIELAQTLVGQDASGQLRVANTGTVATGPLALSITGAAANDFILDNTLTTCAARALGPGESCDIVVRFRPMAAGERLASLVVASSPGGMRTIALKGFGIMPDLHFNPTSLSFGVLEIGQGSQTTVELRNDGALAVPISAIGIAGAAFTKGFSTCGSMLAASSSCDIAVSANPQALGALAGNLSVTSGTDVFSAPLSVRGARRVTVVTGGNGSGTVMSAPAGIACGSTCTGLFEDALTLTAAPGASSQITSWSIGTCGQSTTCLVPADTAPITVNISFALIGTASLSITFVGNGTGEVEVVKTGAGGGVLANCFASCPVPVNAGDTIRLRAATFSTYGGFSDGCVSLEGECTFTAQPGTTNVNVTIQKDPKEQWTRLVPGGQPRGVEFDGSGNLIIASNTKLAKLSPTGSTLWSQDHTAIGGLDTGPGDTIYVKIGPDLKKLDSNGGEIWSHAIAGGGTAQCHGVAVAADGSVVVRNGHTLERRDAVGALAWTRTFTGALSGRCSVAIDASGNVLADVENSNFEATDARRFAADGTALTDVENITFQYRAMLNSSLAGSVVACSTGFSRAYVTGGPATTISGAGSAPNWCSHSGTDIGWVFLPDEAENRPVKWFARRVAGGVASWALTRDPLFASFVRYGTEPSNVAISTAGRIAVVGRYWGLTVFETGWVQVFDP